MEPPTWSVKAAGSLVPTPTFPASKKMLPSATPTAGAHWDISPGSADDGTLAGAHVTWRESTPVMLDPSPEKAAATSDPAIATPLASACRIGRTTGGTMGYVDTSYATSMSSTHPAVHAKGVSAFACTSTRPSRTVAGTGKSAPDASRAHATASRDRDAGSGVEKDHVPVSEPRAVAGPIARQTLSDTAKPVWLKRASRVPSPSSGAAPVPLHTATYEYACSCAAARNCRRPSRNTLPLASTVSGDTDSRIGAGMSTADSDS